MPTANPIAWSGSDVARIFSMSTGEATRAAPRGVGPGNVVGGAVVVAAVVVGAPVADVVVAALWSASWWRRARSTSPRSRRR